MDEGLEDRNIRFQLRFKYVEGIISLPYYIIWNLIGAILSIAYIPNSKVPTPLVLASCCSFVYSIMYRSIYYNYYRHQKLNLRNRIKFLKVIYWISSLAIALASLCLVEIDHRTIMIACLSLGTPVLNLLHRLIIWSCVPPDLPLNDLERKYYQAVQNRISAARSRTIQPSTSSGSFRADDDVVVIDFDNGDDDSGSEDRSPYQVLNEKPFRYQTFVAEEDILDDGEVRECIICLHGLEKQELLATTECLCIFHEGCISGWTNKKNSCPIPH